MTDIHKWVLNQLKLLDYESSYEKNNTAGRPTLKISCIVSVTPSKGHFLVELECRQSKLWKYDQFSAGDIVGFTDKDGVVLSGIVAGLTAPHITVSVSSDPTNKLKDEENFLLVKLRSDATYNRMKYALRQLLSSNLEQISLFKELFFGNPVTKEVDLPPVILSDSGEINFINDKLHENQKKAVEYSLKQEHVAIIQGPPGTGKTTTLVEIILQLVKAKQKVLVTAPSNVAVDNILERLTKAKCRAVRLGHPVRTQETLQQFSLDSVIASSDNAEILSEIRTEIDDLFHKIKKKSLPENRVSVMKRVRELRSEIKRRELSAEKDILCNADVILCTLTTANDGGPLKPLRSIGFDVVIIDECSQGMEAACWIALPWAHKVVMAGDHQQLPPTVMSPEGVSGGLAVSLMERIIDKFPFCMLTQQFRMNEGIMNWVSSNNYGGKLTADTSVANHLLKDLPGVTETDETETPLLFIDTDGMDYEETVNEEGSYANEEEAVIVAALVNNLIEAGVQKEAIAVITPYSNQVRHIRSLLDSDRCVEVKTVDGFQGREKEAVILSLVRTNRQGNLGFLTDKRRLNVAVSRARRFLGIVGDSVTVRHDKTIASLLNCIEESGIVLSPDFYSKSASKIETATLTKTEFNSLPAGKEMRAKALKTDIKTGEATHSYKPKYSETADSGTKAAGNAIPKLSDSNEPGKSLAVFEDGNATKSSECLSLALSSKSIQETDGDRLPVKSAVTIKKSSNNGGARNEKNSDTDDTALRIDEWKVKLEEIFFLASGTVERCFTNLTPYERMLIHEAAAALNLDHESFGEGKNRFIVVRVPKEKRSVDTGFVEEEKKEKTIHNLPKNEQAEIVTNNRKTEDVLKKGDNSKKKMKSDAKEKVTKIKSASDEDFDSMINHFQKMDLKCKFSHCKKSTELISCTCIHCKQRFCFEHGLPEIHGCGEAAKKHAQKTFRHPPPVKVKEQERDQKLKKLQNKLKEKCDERKAKTKKK